MKQKNSQSQSWGLWSQSPAHKSNKLDQSTWRSLLLKQGWLAGMKMNRVWNMLCWFPRLTSTKPEILRTGWYITWKIYSQTREQQMGTKTERVVDAFLTHLFQVFSDQGKRLSREFKQREGGFLLPLFLILPDRRTQREKLRWVPPKRGNNNSSKNHHWMLKLLGKSFPERRYSHCLRVSIYGVLTNYKRKMCLYHGETWRSPLDQVVHFGLSIHKMTWPLVPCNWTQERRECRICGTLAKKL